MSLRIGVDTGGTFTDLVLVDTDSGEIRLHKLPSTPDDPSAAILLGLRELTETNGRHPSEITFLGHGTTVATNAVIEGQFAKTGLIATRGFRDIVELARQRRPHLYDLDVDKPPQIAPRNLRWELAQRTQYDGQEIEPIDLEGLNKILERIEQNDIDALAIVLLHSYANPAHEQLVRDMARERFPDLYVCASSDILPEFREYERTATTLLNASLMPLMTRYINRLEAAVLAYCPAAQCRLMQSSGGLMGFTATSEMPLSTLASGPSGGVIAATMEAVPAGFPNLITLDVGGTSTDVCLVEEGAPSFKHERSIVGHPIKIPTLDVQSVGAGGGSIAYVDDGGLLKVGPRSAGAWPGPACYGRGGEEPTVTDANVVLGYLNPDYLLSGEMPIDAAKAADAIENKVARPLGISIVEAALGIVRVVGVSIQRAIRVISVERGRDPRQLTLVAFGGAGPLHGAQLARDMAIPTVLVPRSPGVLSALGLLMADVRADFGRTVFLKSDDTSFDQLEVTYRELEQQAATWLEREGISSERRVIARTADMSYVGQAFELSVPLSDGTGEGDLLQIVQRFHEEHERAYGYAAPDAPSQIVNLRVVAVGRVAKPPLPMSTKDNGGRQARPNAHRAVHFADGQLSAGVYERALLRAGQTLMGPAVIEQLDATTLVLPDQRVDVDDHANLILQAG
jgi:N-methylhydantoinase A